MAPPLLAVAVGFATPNVPLTEGSPKHLSQIADLSRCTCSALEKDQET